MSRPYFAPKQTYVGTGSLAVYTFAFKIEVNTQLLVVVINTLNVEVQRVRGNDVTYLSSVVFDAVLGGGTVTLLANLPAGYKIALIQANDVPSQSYEFSNKTSFSLKRFENALDFIVGPIQRLVLRANQSLRIHDLDDESTFNTQLPPGIATKTDCILAVNLAGTQFTFGPTVTQVEGWKTSAEAAAAAALISEGNSASSAAASAASAVTSAASANASAASAAAALVSQNAAAQSAIDAVNAALSVTPKYQFIATQTLNNNDKIAVDPGFPMQMVQVQGNAGDITVNLLPFIAPPDAGSVLTIMGMSDIAKVILLHNDVAGGLFMREDEYLGAGQSVTLVYNPTLNRYFKINRSF